ncbi:hypothetical protein [Gorillibacterium sp. sgz5001074]|uniref:hypothetical protein n=1 Tax=Gorillibacterium sp. sgz5001074 TaxID=3446695 RepID=UPI003F67C06C
MNDQPFIRLVERLRDRDPSLFPTGIWDEGLDRRIADLITSDLAEDRSRFDLAFGLAVKAGLHLWNESLNRSHVLSQDIHNPTGSYWHGIMHRMEGDYENAKYWMVQAGPHPVFERLQTVKSELLRNGDWEQVEAVELRVSLHQFYLQRTWDPCLFIDLVQGTVTSGHELKLERLLTALQKHEIVGLLEYSYRNASGGHSLEPFNR